MRPIFCFITVTAALVAGAQFTEAGVLHAEAFLDGLSENPPNAVPGTGFATVRLDTDAHELLISIIFSDLTGTTTVAHIHAPVDPPGNVGVAVTPGTLPGFPVGVTGGTYQVTLDTTQATTYTNAFMTTFGGGTPAGAEQALFNAILAGQAYVNIHTTFDAAGEIRGFLQPVTPAPEPATLLIFGAGVAGLVVCRRKTRTAA